MMAAGIDHILHGATSPNCKTTSSYHHKPILELVNKTFLHLPEGYLSVSLNAFLITEQFTIILTVLYKISIKNIMLIISSFHKNVTLNIHQTPAYTARPRIWG